MELKIEYVDINSIKPYKNNAKLHPEEQIEQIKKSIDQFGMDDPIGIWKDEIVEGHGRLIACKELGYTEVPIIRLDHLTDEERKAYTLAHNKLTMNSDFDFDILQEELDSMETIDMSDFGFDLDLDIDEEEQEIIEDEVPEVPEEPKAKLGDIYQLGNHRLMCGDSTSEEDVSKLMNGVKADMVFTDPPYNINFQGTMSCTSKNGEIITMKDGYKPANSYYDDIKNDMKSKEEFKSFINIVLQIIKNYCIGGYYICFSSSTLDELLIPLIENNMKWKSIIIYNKNQSPLGGGDFRKKYEPICYGYFEHNYYGTPYSEDDVWDIQRTLKNDLHPTMKPIPLITKALKYSSIENQSVLDLFGGSGSTLIACEQLNRKCYMMELDPHYIDVIIQRWENFTGEKAVKIN